MLNLWAKFGRSYFQRHDYENLEGNKANQLFSELKEKLSTLEGTGFAGEKIITADDFSYTDPVDDSLTTGQGVRLILSGDSRVVVRLSGTGTQGATLRIYYECFKENDIASEPAKILSKQIQETREFLKLKELFGSDEPTVIT